MIEHLKDLIGSENTGEIIGLVVIIFLGFLVLIAWIFLVP